VQAVRDYAAGSPRMIPIDPVWDDQVLDTLENDRLADVDARTVEWMGTEGGGSAHEVRTWIAAFVSLAATGDYRMTSRFYPPIPEWIAGLPWRPGRRAAGRNPRRSTGGLSPASALRPSRTPQPAPSPPPRTPPPRAASAEAPTRS
jgi:hypothetical protein